MTKKLEIKDIIFEHHISDDVIQIYNYPIFCDDYSEPIESKKNFVSIIVSQRGKVICFLNGNEVEKALIYQNKYAISELAFSNHTISDRVLIEKLEHLVSEFLIDNNDLSYTNRYVLGKYFQNFKALKQIIGHFKCDASLIEALMYQNKHFIEDICSMLPFNDSISLICSQKFDVEPYRKPNNNSVFNILIKSRCDFDTRTNESSYNRFRKGTRHVGI